MGLFSFLNPPVFDFGSLKIDMHSHLIPGIDDGAKTLAESLELIREMSALGFTKLITTPHIMAEYFPNTPEIILSGLENVQSAIKEQEIDIEILAAAEYYVDETFEQVLDKGNRLLTFGDNHVLIEFSMLAELSNATSIVFKLITKGYRPILAHPERYTYYAQKMEIYQKFKSMGCELQVNLLSLLGHYGRVQKKIGFALIEAGLVDFLGSDVHKMKHIDLLNTVSKNRTVSKLLKNRTFKNNQITI